MRFESFIFGRARNCSENLCQRMKPPIENSFPITKRTRSICSFKSSGWCSHLFLFFFSFFFLRKIQRELRLRRDYGMNEKERETPFGFQARWYAVGSVSCKFAVSLPRKMTLDRYSFLVFSPCLCIMQAEGGRREKSQGNRARIMRGRSMMRV